MNGAARQFNSMGAACHWITVKTHHAVAASIWIRLKLLFRLEVRTQHTQTASRDQGSDVLIH